MIFTTAEKLKIESQVSEILFENKILLKGPAFSLQSKDAAINYGRSLGNLFFLIVEDKNYVTVWTEKKKPKVISKEQTAKTKSRSTEHQPSVETMIDQGFLLLCQQELAKFIGPIASVACQNVLKSFKGNLTQKKT